MSGKQFADALSGFRPKAMALNELLTALEHVKANIAHLGTPEVRASSAHKERAAARETCDELIAAEANKIKDELAALDQEIDATYAEERNAAREKLKHTDDACRHERQLYEFNEAQKKLHAAVKG